jgi:hypothetical protein
VNHLYEQHLSAAASWVVRGACVEEHLLCPKSSIAVRLSSGGVIWSNLADSAEVDLPE